jgi:hypothetical protein
MIGHSEVRYTLALRAPRTSFAWSWARLLATGLFALASAAAGPLLPGGYFFSAAQCGGSGWSFLGFGTCSSGTPYPGVSGDGLGQIGWSQDHFGIFARASANSTGNAGVDVLANPIAQWDMETMIPAQGSLGLGQIGTFVLPFHLDGSVNIDWGDVFVGGFNVATSSVDLAFGMHLTNSTDLVTFTQLDYRHWTGNKLTASVNDNLMFSAPFRVGEAFIFGESLSLRVHANSGAPPEIGSVQADFLHTGTIGQAVILDSSGNPVSNPLILSANGFDFGTSSSAPSVPSVPEPGSLWLMASAILAAGGFQKLRGASR